MARGTLRMMALAACALLAAAATACGDDDDDGDQTPAASPTTANASTPLGGAGTVVEVQLVEFSVIPLPSTVSAGSVTFRATNEGPDDVHEFVIISTDLEPDALPTADDGSVVEDGLDVVDEIEDIPVGETQDVTVDLEAGSYVLICNIVEEENAETVSHYQRGMRRAFTVE